MGPLGSMHLQTEIEASLPSSGGRTPAVFSNARFTRCGRPAVVLYASSPSSPIGRGGLGHGGSSSTWTLVGKFPTIRRGVKAEGRGVRASAEQCESRESEHDGHRRRPGQGERNPRLRCGEGRKKRWNEGQRQEIRWEGRSPCWRGPDRRMRNGTTTRTTKRLVVIRLAE
jgi:hypothetical protein